MPLARPFGGAGGALVERSINGDEDEGEEDTPLMTTAGRRDALGRRPASAVAGPAAGHGTSPLSARRSVLSTPAPGERRSAESLFDRNDVRLLRSQAGRMIRTAQGEADPWPRRVALVLLVLYFGAGLVWFALDVRSIRSEGVRYPVVDAWYFTTVTLTTVGYGDLVPHGTLDYIFVSLFALVGVGVVGFCFGVLVDHLQELAASAAADAIRDGHGRPSDDASLMDLTPRAATAEDLLQRKQAEALSRERRRLIECAVGLVVTLAVGTLIVYLDGGVVAGESADARVTVAQAFYFACVTVTTIGYGDVVVKTPVGMCVISVYLIFSTLLFGKIVTTLAHMPLNRRQRRREAKILTQFGRSLDADELLAICEGGECDTEISKAEFILRMLVWLDRVSVDEVEIIAGKFDLLDKTKDGILSVDDVRHLDVDNRWGGVRDVFLGPFGSQLREAMSEAPSAAARRADDDAGAGAEGS